jgi:hypothetical protein
MAYDSNASPGMILICSLHSLLLNRLHCSFCSLSPCSTMAGYVWWGHTEPSPASTKSCLSMLFIKRMQKKLEYLCFDTHKGVQQVVIQETTQARLYKREEDLFHKLMKLSLYDDQNSIREWTEHGCSNEDPLLDEEDTQSDTPMSSRVVT